MANGFPNRFSGDSSPRRVRGIGARTLLATAVAVPLAGLALATWPSVDEARAVSDNAARLEESAHNVETLTRLDGALFYELSVTVVCLLVDTLGVPPEFAAAVFGEDPAEGVMQARAATDAIIAEGGLGSVEERLSDIRLLTNGKAEAQTAYGEIRADVRLALDVWLDDLASLPRVSSPELLREIDVLVTSVAARSAIADAYYAYFSVLFDVRDTPVTELARLINARDRLELALADLEGSISTDPLVAQRADGLLTNPAILGFVDVINDLITTSLDEGVDERGLELTLPNAFSLGTDLAAVAVGANGSGAATLVLIDNQAEQVVATAEAIRVDADRDRAGTYALAFGLLAISIGAVTIAGRFIAAPLRRLEADVDELFAGAEIDHDRPTRGPREVKAATAALRRVSQHFALASEQARQLAAGELDAAVLDERVEGGLGDSLQAAVDRLRNALAHQNEFRRRLTHEASHDGLTQIPNRNASLAQLTQALARARRGGSIELAVLFIDLDNFKDINDQHGHHAGDVVLTEVAKRLVSGAREGDFVGRLGGDEFIVVAESVSTVSDAAELAQRLLDELRQPIALLDNEVTARASIGIAMAEHAHLSAEELLRDADLAVYRAKAAGRGGIEICDEALREQFVRDTDLVLALQRAIAEDEFVLHYQPIVDAATRKPRSIEALVRWRRPDTNQIVPPGRFIEFAERSPLIIDIDRWVIDAVAAQLAQWQTDRRSAGIPMSVNISGRHLNHPQLVHHILEPLRTYGVDPELLIVEVTESALINDLTTASIALGALRAEGVQVAIDDFGTGYTSLAHLRGLPVDILKIDRSFTAAAISDPGEAAIMKLIIDAGHLLGATVTAEGIQSAAGADRLTELGADTLQGFYFAEPRPAEEVLGTDLVAVPSAR